MTETLDPLAALVLGVVQGATEFLPVSSSGHLVVVQEVLGLHVQGIVFEVVVHAATLLSILVVYRSRVADLARGVVTGQGGARRYVALLALATLPAALVGLFFKDAVEALFDDPFTPGIALLLTGVILWSSRAALRRTHRDDPTWILALAVGLAQAAALVPGISRSGATVVTALWLGLQAREAAAFSFLMAVPAIAGALVLMLPELSAAGGPSGLALAVGGVAAAVTGVLAIRTFVAMLDRRAFWWFAPYCWGVGTLYLGWLVLR